jgi:GTP cyclohydrolase IA
VDLPRANAEGAIEIGLMKLIEDIIGAEMTDDQARSVAGTPKRWLKALMEMTAGYQQDPEEILSRRFEQKFDEMVVVKDIHFTSVCEHHLLPFVGKATIAYIPGESVVGLSKIPRLVDCYAHRLQLQERMTVQIADALETHLKPLGVGVILEAHHECMSCRGIRKQDAKMVTSDLRGRFKENSATRAEFLRFM